MYLMASIKFTFVFTTLRPICYLLKARIIFLPYQDDISATNSIEEKKVSRNATAVP